MKLQNDKQKTKLREGSGVTYKHADSFQPKPQHQSHV